VGDRERADGTEYDADEKAEQRTAPRLAGFRFGGWLIGRKDDH
jgi:hypothetical protein